MLKIYAIFRPQKVKIGQFWLNLVKCLNGSNSAIIGSLDLSELVISCPRGMKSMMATITDCANLTELAHKRRLGLDEVFRLMYIIG